MPNPDALSDIVNDCIKMLDDNIDILSDIEYFVSSEKEDKFLPNLSKTDLLDMVQDVVDSDRIRKAESKFMRRRVEQRFDP